MFNNSEILEILFKWLGYDEGIKYLSWLKFYLKSISFRKFNKKNMFP